MVAFITIVERLTQKVHRKGPTGYVSTETKTRIPQTHARNKSHRLKT